MFGYNPSIFIYILLPASTLFSVYFFDFISKKKINIIFGLSYWCFNMFVYYSVVFGYLIHIHITPICSSFGASGNYSITLLYFISVSQIFVYSFFFKKSLSLLPVLFVLFSATIPALLYHDFVVYFICVEVITMLLGFIFVKNNRSVLFNQTLLGFIISNFITLVMFSISTSLLYFYFGTTDLDYVNVLVNNSNRDSAIIIFIIFSIFLKIGQFPILLYKFYIYNGLGTVQLALYSITYVNLLTYPSIIIIKSLMCLLAPTLSTVVPLFFYFLTLSVAFSSHTGKDFLAISTSLFTVFLAII